MTQILGAGSVGYDDYQRTANWDSGELYSFHAPPSNSTLQTPFLAVPRYASIAGLITVGTGPVIMSWQWSADSGGVSALGNLFYVISPLINHSHQFHIPNMGPYVSLTQQPAGGGNWNSDGILIGTNRPIPILSVPVFSAIIDNQNQAAPAGTTTMVYPQDYYSGPLGVWFNAQAVNMSLILYLLNTGGVWDLVWQGPLFAAAGSQQLTIMAPTGAWRFGVNNPGGVSSYSLAAIPSLTGA